MKSNKPPPVALVEADQAIGGLLETLLAEVPEYAVETPIEQSTEKATSVVVEKEVETLLNIAETPPIQQAETVEVQPVIPEWAESDFKSLIVTMGKARFAVPLISLNGIAAMTENDVVNQIPGQPEWHRGVIKHRDNKVVVVDLSVFLNLQQTDEKPAYILLIDHGRYGLACQSIEEPLTVYPKEVKWSKEGSQRDWLAGMLKEQMCALLDINAIAQRLTKFT